MEVAAQIGVGITEFWEITPRELSIAAAGYAKRLEAEQKTASVNNAMLAFLVSRWVWQKRVNIKKVIEDIGGKQKKRDMTDEEMLAKVRALNRMFGGEEA